MDERYARNPYEVLGVGPGTPEAEIKAAYRARSLLYHPDRLAGAPEAARQVALAEMKALNEAYGILKDSHRRAALDRRLARAESKPVPPVSNDAGGSNGCTRPSRAVSAARVRVNVTAGHATGRYQPNPATFPPAAPPPQTARAAPPPARYADLRADLWRFLLFGAFTSPGWVIAMVIGVLVPPLGWLTGPAFGLGVLAGLPVTKPDARRRPIDRTWWVYRGVLLALLLAAAVVVVVFPDLLVALTGTDAVGSAGGASQALPWLAVVTFVLAAHWGICLLGYILS
ncbi:MAG: J domain-containing protein [Anaerolineae bacterium]|nr:J domain-containing protein [Anaerolineae bacterium]